MHHASTMHRLADVAPLPTIVAPRTSVMYKHTKLAQYKAYKFSNQRMKHPELLTPVRLAYLYDGAT